MSKGVTCCFNCESRFIGCHAECINYIKEQEESKNRAKLIYKNKKKNSEMANYKIIKEINRRKRDKKCTKY